jgi:PAS domain S-box-containing protein
VNEATVRATGIERASLIGSTFEDYFTDPSKAREVYQQAFQEGFVADCPLTVRHNEGRLIDFLYNASVYRNAEARVVGVFASARDVTQSTRAMQEFSETKTFLGNILQSSIKYSIIGTDLEYEVLSWNKGARVIYGYDEAEIVGRKCDVLYAPDEVASGALKHVLAKAFDTGLAERDFRHVRRNGSHFLANCVVTRRDDSSGSPIGYLLMSTDITEKKLAEQKLREAAHYARSLVEASLDPLVTISPDGKITDVNEATSLLTSVPREQLIGTDFSDYFTAPQNARAAYEQVFSAGYVTDYPLSIRRDNRLIHVAYNASVYRDSQGKVLGVFAAARDVTAQKEAQDKIAEQQAREAQRTRELERLAELERFQRLTLGRELKMIELKQEIEELKRMIQVRQPEEK